jgi:hypothetical protein
MMVVMIVTTVIVMMAIIVTVPVCAHGSSCKYRNEGLAPRRRRRPASAHRHRRLTIRAAAQAAP